jgi:hypothetical protein
MLNLDSQNLMSTALQWRIENGYVDKGGVVVIFNDEVQGWVNELRNVLNTGYLDVLPLMKMVKYGKP